MKTEMSKPVLVSKAALAPGSKVVVEAIRQAVADGVTVPLGFALRGPFTTMRIPNDIYTAINLGRGYAARFVAYVILGDTERPPMTEFPEPLNKAARAVRSARADRVRTAIEDAEDGKWARIIFTAGHRSVDQYREDGDYADEIERGLVFRTVVPPNLTAEDAVAWVRRKFSGSARMHWHYFDGDSETISDARDALMRAAVVSLGGEGAKGVALVEADEMLEIRVFGRK